MKENVILLATELTDTGIVELCKNFPGKVYVSEDKETVAVAYNEKEINSTQLDASISDIIGFYAGISTQIRTTYNINIENADDLPFGKRTFVRKIKHYSTLARAEKELSERAKNLDLLKEGNLLTLTKETHLYDKSLDWDACFGRTEITFIPLKGKE